MVRDLYHRFLENLRAKREPGVGQARLLIRQQRYDEAEAAVRAVDDSIYGSVALAGLFRDRLVELVTGGMLDQDRDQVEAVFRRAKSWACNTCPEPHTAYEARDRDRANEGAIADLVAIMGYDPGPVPDANPGPAQAPRKIHGIRGTHPTN